MRHRGASGKAAPGGYKVCATYLDGYKMTAVFAVAGGRARDKARATADAILRRAKVGFAKMGFEDFTATDVQIIGAGEMFGDQVTTTTKTKHTLSYTHTLIAVGRRPSGPSP